MPLKAIIFGLLMISFPNAKINIGLHITAKRADGFHQIESIMYPIPYMRDALEIIPNKQFSLQLTGATFNGTMQENLVVKAWQLLHDAYKIPTVEIHLHKAIPNGAGLGGGSADAAQMLLMLNKTFSLALSTEQLQEYAAQLGSDCPFFITNQPCYASGRGEILQAIKLDLSKYCICLVKPPFSINTAKAYRQCIPKPMQYNLQEAILQPLHTWRKQISNDFEQLAGEHNNAILHIKETLYQAGAIYSAMSGSGSVVYGIFEKELALSMPDTNVYWSNL